MKKIWHKIATYLEWIPYTLEDIIEKAQKTDKKEVIITARTRMYPMIENFGKYQPIAIIGKELMDVGKSVDVDFNVGADILESVNLRHEVIEERQNKVEKILWDYIKKLRNSGINAGYCNFNRGY